MHYVNRMQLREYESSIQLLQMRFRRLAIVRKPIRLKAIRCADKYALIEAGDGHSGYVLQVDETYEDPDATMFRIYTKFQYIQEILVPEERFPSAGRPNNSTSFRRRRID